MNPTAADSSKLANVAYTFAIATLPDAYGVGDFFNRVAERYYQEQLSGGISSNDRHRLNQALTAHCVGWSGHTCNSADYHRTAWNRLPALLTTKSTFGPGFNEHFMRAETMDFVGSPSLVSFGTAADDFGYVQLDSNDDEICETLNYPANGSYQFFAAVKPFVTSDQVQVKIAPNGYVSWDVADGSWGEWQWSFNGPTFNNISAGMHNTCLKRFSGETMRVDAVLIKRVQ